MPDISDFMAEPAPDTRWRDRSMPSEEDVRRANSAGERSGKFVTVSAVVLSVATLAMFIVTPVNALLKMGFTVAGIDIPGMTLLGLIIALAVVGFLCYRPGMSTKVSTFRRITGAVAVTSGVGIFILSILLFAFSH